MKTGEKKSERIILPKTDSKDNSTVSLTRVTLLNLPFYIQVKLVLLL